MIGIYRDRDNGDGVDWDGNGGSGDNGGGDRDFVDMYNRTRMH